MNIAARSDITLEITSRILANGRAGGEMRMESSEGTLQVSGLLDGTGRNGPGGTIYLLAPRVALLRRAVVDVSGDTGGGTILVGGDYQGKNPDIQNAMATYVDADVTLNADAITSGNGGKVIVWANDATRVYGTITARGGAQGGDGGFVETSGHYLDVSGINVNTSARQGSAGTWLLDPTNIYIAVSQVVATAAGMAGTDISASSGSPNFAAMGAVQDSLLLTGTLTSALATTNVTVTTANAAGIGLGDINVVSPVAYNSAFSLTLTANRNINMIGNGLSNPGLGAINLTATGTLTVQNAVVTDRRRNDGQRERYRGRCKHCRRIINIELAPRPLSRARAASR